MTAIQTPLDFDTCLEQMCAPAQSHSPTSIAAAKAIEPKAGRGRGLVLDYLRSRGAVGATDEEMQIALADVMPPNTQRPRRGELADAGLIYKSGQTRKTLSGHPAVVWVAHQKEGV